VGRKIRNLSILKISEPADYAWAPLLIKNSIQFEPRQGDEVLIDLSGPISGKNNLADRGLLGIFLDELT
jgi:hypothetical protein